MGTEFTSPPILDHVLRLCWGGAGAGIGQDDPCGSLAARDILGFHDPVNSPACLGAGNLQLSAARRDFLIKELNFLGW